ncbi:MAG: helix-turn-helix domain-containing protein [Clostridia bacterium]|nr:helix-turn-helix domain-containing protein [Clostridia bacterium]
MDLIKSGKLLCDLRKAKGMTQAEVAKRLGVVPKTVSKWETGHGFPDVATLSALANLLGVSEKTLLSGNLETNSGDAGNMKRIKFYVCPVCTSFMQGVGNCQLTCCGKQLQAIKASPADDEHAVKITEIEDDLYIEFNHEMTKEHYISFVSYVRFDRVLTVKLYPEQDGAVRIPKIYGDRIYFYCTKHGLFEHAIKLRRRA